jgi:plastocyanin
MSHQALAFLPNEIWIHAGESVTWTFGVDEIHTVTFLKSGQTLLPFQARCPGFFAQRICQLRWIDLRLQASAC